MRPLYDASSSEVPAVVSLKLKFGLKGYYRLQAEKESARASAEKTNVTQPFNPWSDAMAAG